MLACWLLFTLLSLSDAFMVKAVTARDAWQKPGCHKVGHTRKISIPECVEFHMTTNACRGFCESWAVPSGPKATPTQPVTSVGQCCNIMETEPVEARVLCVDGVRTLTFKSAVSCSCYHCKKD
ncbi:glycoprotein hormone alpha 2 precursor [Tribolium castaneum]|uniref:Glycoprotein hormone alpha 2 n=1 Tax=Tribolium castaneum TaxID=7070 RepID=D6X356_TRICA|nr:glycoprotein hormone alpha 2 precursor [Tribolium castaneum]EFA10706.1 glycoprotein hormone alpha 2 [Tribolium castaneum]|eukprot:NP_001164244.1 glycoprotein hormone alpha 2 precursor [Tribolium castaneum]